jgi:hypothetical protein
MHGPLPDAAMRKRMVAHMETIPGFATVGDMPWYPGKTFPGVIAQGQAGNPQPGLMSDLRPILRVAF